MQNSYEEHLPAPDLQPWVQCYWSMEWKTASAVRYYRVTPDGCVDLFFRFGAPVTAPLEQPCGGYVIGTMTRPLMASTGGGEGGRLLAVRFEPGGAYRFFGRTAGALTDQRPALSEVWGQSLATQLWEELGCTLNAKERQPALLERMLRQRLAAGSAVGACHTAPWLGQAVALLRDQAGEVRISDLCDYLGLSRQHVARVFSEQVGLTPKQLARVSRLRRLLRRARTVKEINWAALAVEFGFYDQAHLIGECQRLNGQTPTQCLAPSPEEN